MMFLGLHFGANSSIDFFKYNLPTSLSEFPPGEAGGSDAKQLGEVCEKAVFQKNIPLIVALKCLSECVNSQLLCPYCLPGGAEGLDIILCLKQYMVQLRIMHNDLLNIRAKLKDSHGRLNRLRTMYATLHHEASPVYDDWFQTLTNFSDCIQHLVVEDHREGSIPELHIIEVPPDCCRSFPNGKIAIERLNTFTRETGMLLFAFVANRDKFISRIDGCKDTLRKAETIFPQSSYHKCYVVDCAQSTLKETNSFVATIYKLTPLKPPSKASSLDGKIPKSSFSGQFFPDISAQLSIGGTDARRAEALCAHAIAQKDVLFALSLQRWAEAVEIELLCLHCFHGGANDLLRLLRLTQERKQIIADNRAWLNTGQRLQKSLKDLNHLVFTNVPQAHKCKDPSVLENWTDTVVILKNWIECVVTNGGPIAPEEGGIRTPEFRRIPPPTCAGCFPNGLEAVERLNNLQQVIIRQIGLFIDGRLKFMGYHPSYQATWQNILADYTNSFYSDHKCLPRNYIISALIDAGEFLERLEKGQLWECYH
jgi:hypothetical protein